MKIIGIVLLILGLLAIGGGLIGAVVSQVIPNDECDYADQYAKEAEQLSKEAEAARGTPRQVEMQKKAADKAESARMWAEGCRSRKKLTTIGLVAGLIVTVVGFVMVFAGIFLFARGRSKTA